MAKNNNVEVDINQLSFEQAIDKLTEIVGKIERGQIPLAESIAQYEQGMSLIKHCRGILQQAEKKIEKITAEQKETDTAAAGQK